LCISSSKGGAKIVKKTALICMIIVGAIILTSCNFNSIESAEKIAAPANNLPPVSGKWVIDGFKSDTVSGISDEQAKGLVGKESLFHEKVVVLGDDFCLEPSYKIKNVDTKDYLLYQYKVNPEYLGITSDKIQIITIASNDQFFHEFIKESDDKMIVNIDGVFYYMKKVSDNVDEDDIDKYLKKEQFAVVSSAIENTETLRSGILLGLRYYEEGKSGDIEGQWKYRTVWICSRNKDVDKLYETEGLFVPRKNGFWKVGVNREVTDGKVNDAIYARPYTQFATTAKTLQANKDNKSMTEDKAPKENTGNSKKTILYVGNNYMSTEVTELSPKEKKVLRVLPIDGIDSAKPIKISDVVGDSGKSALEEGASKHFSNDLENKSNYISTNPDEENFGLLRRNGHWVMKGRINFDDGEKNAYSDFDIKVVPPKVIVNYDEFPISWSAIKLRVPEAVDAYYSPNDDIVIIITNNNILVYTLENGELSKTPVGKTSLKNGEKVVMSEWATGKYIYIWEEEFFKSDAKEIMNETSSDEN